MLCCFNNLMVRWALKIHQCLDAARRQTESVNHVLLEDGFPSAYSTLQTLQIILPFNRKCSFQCALCNFPLSSRQTLMFPMMQVYCRRQASATFHRPHSYQQRLLHLVSVETMWHYRGFLLVVRVNLACMWWSEI